MDKDKMKELGLQRYKVKLEFDDIYAVSKDGAGLIFWEQTYGCEGELSVLDIEEVTEDA